MKLFTRYTRINLFSTVVIFLLTSVAYYFVLRYVLIDQLDEDLKIEQREIETYVDKHGQLPEILEVKDQQITYTKVTQDEGHRKFRTIKLLDQKEKETAYSRQLIFSISINNQWWLVTVGKSLEGTDDITKSIIIITVLTILAILAVSLLVNRFVLQKLWKPFYHSLGMMQQFELGKKQQPVFPLSDIDEFAFMNETLTQAMTKAEQDYLFLKEFTENASHELQTPLAIIQSKLDLFIQDEHLSENQSRAIQDAYQAIQKLSKLNQSLLLLVKIENGQYTNRLNLDISQKTNEKLLQFAELIQAKGLSVASKIDQHVFLLIDPMLADILLNNLLSNAVRYSQYGGTIHIRVKPGLFEIGNPATADALDALRLFRRFGKTLSAKEGTGLGLAIIKQVCAVSNLDPGYVYRDHFHYFSITWTPAAS